MVGKYPLWLLVSQGYPQSGCPSYCFNAIPPLDHPNKHRSRHGISGSKELYHISIRKHLNAIALLEEVFVTSVLKQQISHRALNTAGTQSFTIFKTIQALPGIIEMAFCNKKNKATSLQHRLCAVVSLLIFQTSNTASSERGVLSNSLSCFRIL